MWRFSRSSGPGGQHVNTSDSRWSCGSTWRRRMRCRGCGRNGRWSGSRAGWWTGSWSYGRREHRSQWRNRETALVRLASVLAEATAPPPKQRRPTKIPRGINERRLRQKKERSETKKSRTPKNWD